MELHQEAREYFDLAIATTPTLTGWEASFDGGETWVAGEAVTGGARWLVAGAQADPGDATVIANTVHPKVRAIANPEIVVRNTPAIVILA